ncbi:MAG: translation elongation factor Ts [Pseudomonadota bacterium]
MSISASMVKELREKTGAGMMDCKKALAENSGDMDQAIDWLRTKGLSTADKKSGRVASDGLVAVATDGAKAAVVEVNSETDFVARNESFQALASNIAQASLSADGDVAALLGAPYPGSSNTVEAHLKDAIATIGENMTVRRTAVLSVDEGVVASYVHNAAAPGLGKIGVLVALKSAGSADQLNEIGRQIAMHVAASSPLAITVEELDPEVVDRERGVYTEQARESGKPDNIVEKMVEGRLRKYYEQVVLLKQAFVVDTDKTVDQALKDAAASAGAPIEITGMVRFGLGEGIEKEETDFAAEVAAMSAQ